MLNYTLYFNLTLNGSVSTLHVSVSRGSPLLPTSRLGLEPIPVVSFKRLQVRWSNTTARTATNEYVDRVSLCGLILHHHHSLDEHCSLAMTTERKQSAAQAAVPSSPTRLTLGQRTEFCNADRRGLVKLPPLVTQLSDVIETQFRCLFLCFLG